MKRSAGGVLRREGLTLLMTLGIVYLFVSGTLPAILERQELRRQRLAEDRELQAVQERVRNLRDWNAGGREDPMLRERILERLRRSQESPGYRVIPAVEVPDEGDGSGR